MIHRQIKQGVSNVTIKVLFKLLHHSLISFGWSKSVKSCIFGTNVVFHTRLSTNKSHYLLNHLINVIVLGNIIVLGIKDAVVI